MNVKTSWTILWGKVKFLKEEIRDLHESDPYYKLLFTELMHVLDVMETKRMLEIYDPHGIMIKNL